MCVIKTLITVFIMMLNSNTVMICSNDGNIRWSGVVLEHDHDEGCTYLITHVSSNIPNLLISEAEDKVVNTIPVFVNRGRELAVVKVNLLIGMPAKISKRGYMQGDQVFAGGWGVLSDGFAIQNYVGQIVRVDAKRIYVDFIPPMGFTGSGLFDRDGQLIGICYGVAYDAKTDRHYGVYTRIIGINDRGKGVKIRCVKKCWCTPRKRG